MSGGVHTEAEGFIKRRLTVMTTHSCLLLDDPFLGGDVHHVELYIKICEHTHIHINVNGIIRVLMLVISTILKMGGV